VLVDGVDVSTLGLRTLRSAVAVIPQVGACRGRRGSQGHSLSRSLFFCAMFFMCCAVCYACMFVLCCVGSCVVLWRGEE
jgi:hypothetical protein